MLILTRKYGESIWVGDDIKITLFRNDGYPNSARIAITAPSNISILREELRTNKEGSCTKPSLLWLP